MTYRSLRECVDDLETAGHLLRIEEEIDPYLEMAEIQRRVFQAEDRHFTSPIPKAAVFPWSAICSAPWNAHVTCFAIP